MSIHQPETLQPMTANDTVSLTDAGANACASVCLLETAEKQARDVGFAELRLHATLREYMKDGVVVATFAEYEPMPLQPNEYDSYRRTDGRTLVVSFDGSEYGYGRRIQGNWFVAPAWASCALLRDEALALIEAALPSIFKEPAVAS